MIIHIALLFVLTVNSCSTVEDEPFPGFALSFDSNTLKIVDELIFFNKSFPSELKGYTFVSNGVGAFEMGPRKVQHAFDGFAKLASFSFDNDNRIRFSFNFIQSDEWIESNKLNDIAPYLTFESVDPPFGYFDKLKAFLNGLDNANVNVVSVGKSNQRSYLATSDMWKTYEIEPRNLTTIRKVQPPVPGAAISFLSSISTSHVLPENGTYNLLTFATSALPWEDIFASGRLRVVRIKSPDDRELITEWSLKKSPYMHSFSATGQYTIIAAGPLTIDTSKMMKTFEAISSLDWKPEEEGTMYIVNNKNPSEKYSIPYKDGVYHMHHINAYERTTGNGEKSIVFHATSYDNINFFHGLEVKRMHNKTLANEMAMDSHIRRYEIFLSNHTVKSTVVEPRPDLQFLHHLEMPAINEEYRFKEYCYIYGIVGKIDGVNVANSSLAKRNLCNNKEDAIWFEQGHYPSEPKFIPKADAVSEDDGYLVGIMLNGWTEKSYLGIWDAKTMSIINRAYLPIFIPYRLHGNFFEKAI